MPEEKRWRIASAKKIAPESRDLARRDLAEPEDYMDIAGGDDEGPSAAAIGENVVFAANLTDEAAREWAGASNLRYLEDDQIDTVDTEDTSVPEPGEVEPDSLSEGVEQRALKVHQLAGRRADGVIVGVIDTGLSYYHAGRYFKDALLSRWYWVTDSSEDRRGHGTHVAGLALPQGAQLVVHKALDDNGSGSRSTIIKAMYHFYNQCRKEGKPGALNMSLSGPGYSQAYQDAIAEGESKGCITGCSAGNDGRNSGHKVGGPGNSESAVCSGAFDYDMRKADFSTTGKEVDCAGMGVRVEGFGLDSRNVAMSGTSMSCPVSATRAAACLLAIEKDVGKVKKALYAGCDDTPAPVTHEGHGIVKAGVSEKKLQPERKPPKKVPRRPVTAPHKSTRKQLMQWIRYWRSIARRRA